MKKLVASIALFAASAFALNTAALAAGEHEHGKPQHGGVVAETKTMDLELVAKPELIQLYVSDHGKPIKIDTASAKLTLLTGSEKSEVPLALVGDKLEAKGSFKVAKGTKAVAVVTLNGKAPVTARFELK
jgi:hypothetical protein